MHSIDQHAQQRDNPKTTTWTHYAQQHQLSIHSCAKWTSETHLQICLKRTQQNLFGNLPEIMGMHESFLKDLEACFAEWPSEHKLAPVFLRYAPFFKAYTAYSVTFERGQELLASIKGKRQGLESAEALAEHDGIAPLDELLRKPLGRMENYVKGLRRLRERTPASASDSKGIDRAIELIGAVAEAIAQSVHRSENQRKGEWDCCLMFGHSLLLDQTQCQNACFFPLFF
jgi:hypothetical protein